jgi:CheY-like chemotaxis protein
MDGPVLVVEDDPEQQDLIVEVLRGAGFRIIASDEGRKALELATVVRPCAVVLDLSMPGMDGREFLRRRRGVPELADTPVIVITGGSVEGVEADAVLHKPFDPRELREAIEHLGS